MKAKTLIETNPYLKDPVQRRRLNELSARTSCGVEGIKDHKTNKTIQIERREKKLFNQLKAKLISD